MTPVLYLDNEGTERFVICMSRETDQKRALHEYADGLNSHVRMCHVNVPKMILLMYLGNGWTDRAQSWHVFIDLIPYRFACVTGVGDEVARVDVIHTSPS